VGRIKIARTIPSRTTDPETSHESYEDVKIRAHTHRMELLIPFAEHETLTYAQAYEYADTESECPWKRCSELRKGGYIVKVGKVMGSKGSRVMQCQITDKGRNALKEHGAWTGS
jgi:hypothetical protein